MAAMTATGTSRHFAAAQQFGRFRSEADIEPLTEPDFDYTSYRIRMMKLQMRVGGMFWCAPPPPADWIEMPVPAKLMPIPVAAALSEMPVATGCVVPTLAPAPMPSTYPNSAVTPLVVCWVENGTL